MAAIPKIIFLLKQDGLFIGPLSIFENSFSKGWSNYLQENCYKILSSAKSFWTFQFYEGPLHFLQHPETIFSKGRYLLPYSPIILLTPKFCTSHLHRLEW